MTDTVFVKCKKLVIAILVVSISISLIRFISLLIFGNILSSLYGSLSIPSIFLQCFIAGVISGMLIRESRGGKLMYAILTTIIALPFVSFFSVVFSPLIGFS